MAALIPFGLMAASAIPGLIGGIMNIANEAKKLSGGKLRRRYARKKTVKVARKVGGKMRVAHRVRRAHKKVTRGRGPVADALGSIPLLGMIAGPLARAFGGRLKKMKPHKRRLVLSYLRNRLGNGLSPMYISRPYVGMGAKKRRGKGLSPMYISRPYVGQGLLYPIGAHSKSAGSRALTLAMSPYKPSKRVVYGPPTAPPGTIIKYNEVGVVPTSLPKRYPGSKFGTGAGRKMSRYFSPLMPWHMSNALPYRPIDISPIMGPGANLLTPGKGLLSPAGGYLRKGHLRKIKGRKARVRVRGGYVPYQWRSRGIYR